MGHWPRLVTAMKFLKDSAAVKAELEALHISRDNVRPRLSSLNSLSESKSAAIGSTIENTFNILDNIDSQPASTTRFPNLQGIIDSDEL